MLFLALDNPCPDLLLFLLNAASIPGSTGLTSWYVCTQGRRNIGPPQTMAWSASEHPGRHVQVPPGTQVAAEGDGAHQTGGSAVPSSAAAERKGGLSERGHRGLEDGPAVQPAGEGTAVDITDGSEGSTEALDGPVADPMSSSAAADGQEVSLLLLAPAL